MATDSAQDPASNEEAVSNPRQAKREEAIRNALSSLIRDFVTHESGAPPDDVAPLDLSLQVRATPHTDTPWDVEFTPDLQEQLREQCAERSADWAAYQPGSVYCFRCKSPTCSHAMPPSPLMVFSGFDATGTPQWHEMVQSLIDARDEKVDRLFEEPPRVVARVGLGHELRMEQLSSFGRASKTYALLGQVAAGYVMLDSAGRRASTAAQRLALSFHVVETRDASGQFALMLNAVCGVPGGATLDELLASDWNPWIRRAKDQAETSLAHIEGQVRKGREKRDSKAMKKALAQVPSVLRQLAGSLERGQRQALRRTRHAEDRRRQRRPVHMAMADTRRATAEDLLFDERTEAIIVCGPKARIHVFAADGRHVTTFLGQPDTTAYRLRVRRWRPLTQGEQDGFLAKTLEVSPPSRR